MQSRNAVVLTFDQFNDELARVLEIANALAPGESANIKLIPYLAFHQADRILQVLRSRGLDAIRETDSRGTVFTDGSMTLIVKKKTVGDSSSLCLVRYPVPIVRTRTISLPRVPQQNKMSPTVPAITLVTPKPQPRQATAVTPSGSPPVVPLIYAQDLPELNVGSKRRDYPATSKRKLRNRGQ